MDTPDPALEARMLHLLAKPNKTAEEKAELSRYYRLDLIALGLPTPPGTPRIPYHLTGMAAPPAPKPQPQKHGPGRTGRKPKKRGRK